MSSHAPQIVHDLEEIIQHLRTVELLETGKGIAVAGGVLGRSASQVNKLYHRWKRARRSARDQAAKRLYGAGTGESGGSKRIVASIQAVDPVDLEAGSRVGNFKPGARQREAVRTRGRYRIAPSAERAGDVPASTSLQRQRHAPRSRTQTDERVAGSSHRAGEAKQ